MVSYLGDFAIKRLPGIRIKHRVKQNWIKMYNVIQWVMAARGVSFPHAMELLKADHPALSAKVDRVVQRGTAETVKLEAPFEMSADDQQVLLQVVDYYHRTLKQSPEALQYLQSRGLNDSEMIDHFKIGFANRTLGYRLPHKNRKAGAEMRGRLERLGIFRAETGHEHFNRSIVIPVFDSSGAVVEMYGRKITRVLTKDLAQITCIFPARIKASGTERRSWPRRKSSCAKPSSTR
jgi:DNA primase